MAIDIVGIKAVVEGLQPYLTSIRQISTQNNNLQVSFKATATASDRAAARMAFFQRSLNVSGIKGITAGSKELSANFANLAVSTQKVSSAAKTTQTNNSNLGRSFGGLTGLVNKAEAAQATFGRALIANTGFGNRFAVSLRFGAAALASFTAGFTISQASKFQDALTKIDNLTNATSGDTAALGKQILELAQTVPKSPEDLGSAAYFILSSGIQDSAKAFDILQVSAKAATGLFVSTEEVAKTLTAVINAYGESNISAAQAADILTAAIREGRAEPRDFANELGTVLGLADTLGVRFDELTASIASLTNTGLSAAEATTAFRGVLNQLISPSQEAVDTFKELGIPIEQIRQTIREKGLIAGLQEVAKAGNNNVQVFAKLLPEVRGLNGFLLAFGSNAEKTNEILQNIQKSAGIVNENFKNSSETFSFQANILKNQLNVLLIQLGTIILPQLTHAFQEVITWVNKNEDAIRDTAKAVVEFTTTTIGDFIRGLGNIVSALVSVENALSFIPDNQATIVAAIAAIGAAMLLAFGPESAAVIGLITIIGFLDRINGMQINLPGTGGTVAVSDTAREAARAGDRATVREELAAQGVPGFALEQATEQLIASQKGLADQEKIAKDQAKALDEGLKRLQASFGDTALASDAGKTSADALKDGIISFAEATELGLNAIQAGALEATTVFDQANEEAFNFTKTLSKVANAFQKSTDAANKLVLALAREALAKIKSAQSAIFGRPTQEVAALELNLAELEAKRAEVAASVVPQIEALQDQLDALNEIDQPKDLGEASTQNVAAVIQQGLQGGMGALNDASQGTAQSLDDQKKAIESQIEALQRQLEVEDRGIQAVERQIAIYEAQSAILQKQIQIADATLLTQDEQKQKALELIEATAEVSAKQRELATNLGEDIIPEMDAMRDAVKLVEDSLKALSDDAFRQQFIPAVTSAAAGAQVLAESTLSAADVIAQAESILRDTMKGLGQPFVLSPIPQVSQELGQFGDPSVTLRDILEEMKKLNDNLGSRQHGGMINSSELSVLHPPELVLPLNEPRRSRELLGSLPPGILTQISGNRSSGPSSIFGGDVNVQGHTLEDMEAATIQTIRRMFEQQRRGFHRQGLR